MMMMSTNYWLNGMNECPLPLLSLSLSLSICRKKIHKKRKREKEYFLSEVQRGEGEPVEFYQKTDS